MVISAGIQKLQGRDLLTLPTGTGVPLKNAFRHARVGVPRKLSSGSKRQFRRDSSRSRKVLVLSFGYIRNFNRRRRVEFLPNESCSKSNVSCATVSP